MIKFLTAGESHGLALVGILEGFPSNIYLDTDFIDCELSRRQRGYGRSNRMAIEEDRVQIVSGISHGYTTGNPISIIINNRGTDIDLCEFTRPRPGHADLPGILKYNLKGGRNVLERASARETAMRVALGGMCKLLLREFNIHVYSQVLQIGMVKATKDVKTSLSKTELNQIEESPVRVLDKDSEKRMIGEIDRAKAKGDSLGGVFEIVGRNIPIGLGSYVNWDRKLDARIAYGIMSLPGIKGIEFGLGFLASNSLGSRVHDEIYYSDNRYHRRTNNAGGIEGGVSNGEDIVFRAIMKPIPTLEKPLRTVDIVTKEMKLAQSERSDTCAVPSASVVAENVLAHTLADEMMRKFGGDSLEETMLNFQGYNESLKNR